MKESNVSIVVLEFFFFVTKHSPLIFVVDEQSYRFLYTAQMILVSPQRKQLESLLLVQQDEI